MFYIDFCSPSTEDSLWGVRHCPLWYQLQQHPFPWACWRRHSGWKISRNSSSQLINRFWVCCMVIWSISYVTWPPDCSSLFLLSSHISDSYNRAPYHSWPLSYSSLPAQYFICLVMTWSLFSLSFSTFAPISVGQELLVHSKNFQKKKNLPLTSWFNPASSLQQLGEMRSLH